MSTKRSTTENTEVRSKKLRSFQARILVRVTKCSYCYQHSAHQWHGQSSHGHNIDPHIKWFSEDLIRLLDQVLVILIALEVMQNLTGYPRDHVIRIELALVTARPLPTR
jgi:hypothetical protein